MTEFQKTNMQFKTVFIFNIIYGALLADPHDVAPANLRQGVSGKINRVHICINSKEITTTGALGDHISLIGGNQ